jgi:hypothetical protein
MVRLRHYTIGQAAVVAFVLEPLLAAALGVSMWTWSKFWRGAVRSLESLPPTSRGGGLEGCLRINRVFCTTSVARLLHLEQPTSNLAMFTLPGWVTERGSWRQVFVLDLLHAAQSLLDRLLFSPPTTSTAPTNEPASAGEKMPGCPRQATQAPPWRRNGRQWATASTVRR